MNKEYENDVPNYRCWDCIHLKSNKKGGYEPCKRIDHDKIKFAKSWFVTYASHMNRAYICDDFFPKYSCGYEWNGFDEYWEKFVEQWLPYGNTDTLVYFTLHDNEEIRYGVPLMDFVNGTMIEGNTLKAVEKTYYRRTREGFGYKLIREKIDGVDIIKRKDEIEDGDR